ncbi:MAG: hypothetical protein PHT58_04305 [Eubacteriales bacterium]|nr:hypothetical protein [Eubacteriales bacterium]
MSKTVLVQNLKLPLQIDPQEYPSLFAGQLSLSKDCISGVRIVRQAIDARKKNDVCFSVHAALTMDDATAQKMIAQKKASELPPLRLTPLKHGKREQRGRIAVVGLGPCGLFAAWQLAQEGYKPLVLERGKCMDERKADVEEFWRSGKVLRNSNAVFGEGGAGTFSDGKLTTRIKDERITKVLRKLISCGAPKEIEYLAKPHIGTDKLREVIVNMRKEIETLGGQVLFSTELVDFHCANGQLDTITIFSGCETLRIPCCALLLAIGQGAGDTYRMLFNKGLALAPKAFAVGVRAEHPQVMINRSQYGDFYNHPRLGAASYALTGKSGERGVYTFCMCPGGKVIGSASADKQVVTNGMSDYARDGENANAAIVVQVTPDDYGYEPLDGLKFREQLEKDAFNLGGGDGVAPACLVGDILKGVATKHFGSVKPTYRPGVKPVDMRDCLPDFVYQGVRDGIKSFARQLKGYDLNDSVLTAVESRTSSPLRILRDDTLQSPTVRGLYPIGEGAGYAGGIVSAAVDGLKAAEQVIFEYKD